MFDIGWQELFLIAVVALVVIGPKDLPMAMRGLARFYAKVRGMSREFQSSVSELMREAELEELKRKFNEAGRTDIGTTIKKAIDPTGSLSADFDPAEFARDLKRRVEGDPTEAARSGTEDARRENESDTIYGPSLPSGVRKQEKAVTTAMPSPTHVDDSASITHSPQSAQNSPPAGEGENRLTGERR